MPDHFHMIINPKNSEDYTKIISSIKRNFTQNIDDDFVAEDISESKIERKEKDILQRRF